MKKGKSRTRGVISRIEKIRQVEWNRLSRHRRRLASSYDHRTYDGSNSSDPQEA